jgi:acetyl-CoA carboxylase alpha subunit
MDSLLDTITAKLDSLDTYELEEVADELGIDTDDLDKDVIIDSIESLFEDFDAIDAGNALELIADTLDIDTDDLSDSEVIESVIEELDEISLEMLMQISRMLNVDMGGSTYSEIIEKVEAALENLE